MNKMLSSSFGRFRFLGFLEGGSLLLLMGVAMPMKYMLDNASWVKIIGPIHGLLFVVYVFEAIRQGEARNWSFWRITFFLLLGSFVPFGTFIADYKLLRPMESR